MKYLNEKILNQYIIYKKILIIKFYDYKMLYFFKNQILYYSK